eukprot:6284259-Pyramimonas_sp.AAC.1
MKPKTGGPFAHAQRQRMRAASLPSHQQKEDERHIKSFIAKVVPATRPEVIASARGRELFQEPPTDIKELKSFEQANRERLRMLAKLAIAA